jgi:uncharacterized repeat protein (TIGR01451 family)
VAANRIEDAELAGNMMQPLAPHGEQQIRLLDALQENNGGVPMDQVVGWKGMSEARVPHEKVDMYKLAMLQDEELAALGRILEGTRTWYSPESLGVMIEGQAAAVLRDEKFAKEILVYETEDKCSLRICKAASHTIADSGDIIQFTIRFDNVGPKPIRKAVIMDSLSPRLEYIENSQQSSIGTRFEANPNEVGSSVLRWEIDGEIEPSTGGVISFDCRVR